MLPVEKITEHLFRTEISSRKNNDGNNEMAVRRSPTAYFTNRKLLECLCQSLCQSLFCDTNMNGVISKGKILVETQGRFFGGFF